MGYNMADVVQKKSTPFKKPKKRGGSPRGVKDPPMLATKNIKNTMIWTFFFLNVFALIRGRIKSIAAPVVPIQLAKTVPMKIIPVFNKGVPTNDPFKQTPPEIVNKDSNNMIKGTYSSKPTCRSSYNVISIQKVNRKGRIRLIAQNNDIFTKL